jgi:endo-1,4-beta-xylanase
LKQQGVPIDGIGTEMHITISTAKAGIDYMFQKLAATGLKIRISELDVKVNGNSIYDFSLTPQVLAYQSTTYHDVVSSYLKNVPVAQRQDITVWGVNDANSWLYKNGADFPLLFDNSYTPKPAYNGFLQALQGK